MTERFLKQLSAARKSFAAAIVAGTSNAGAIAIGATVVLTLFLSGCSSAPSSSSSSTNPSMTSGHAIVRKEPITINRVYFDRGSTMSREFAIEHNQSAHTQWSFHCRPKFHFDVVEKQVNGNLVTLRIKITEVAVFLSAPVTVYLPKLAAPDVVSHEDGHLKICRTVYDEKARAAAEEAANALLGQEFTGTGATREEAAQRALDQAAQSMGRTFRSKTIDYLDRVSAYFDQVAPQHPEAKYVDACIEAAFKAEEKVGVPAN